MATIPQSVSNRSTLSLKIACMMLLDGRLIQPTVLPTNHFAKGTQCYDAFEECLVLEGKDTWSQFANDLVKEFSGTIMADMSPKTVARVLGHALCLSPNDNARDGLAREILGCKPAPDQTSRPELLAGLAHLYVYGMIRIFYNPNGPTLCVSADQSPGNAFDNPLSNPTLLTTPTLLERVLHRDGHRCVLTGSLDSDYFLRTMPDTTDVRITRPAHIISQSFSSEIGGLSPNARAKFYWASSSAAVLQRFGGFSVQDVLGGDNLNSPENAFTLSGDVHRMFDGNHLWLVPVTAANGAVIPNMYHSRIPSELECLRAPFHLKATVSFTAATMDDGTVVPAPSSQLLALHATCAQVAHMSGATGHLYDIFGEPDAHHMPSLVAQPDAPFALAQRLKASEIVYPSSS